MSNKLADTLKGSGLMKNRHIANSHRLYRKFVGHAVSLAGLLAFVTNTLVVPCGLIVLAQGHSSIETLVILGVIGVLLALLADGMTLSACARLRVSLEHIALIKEQYLQVADDEKKAAVVKQEKREMAPHKLEAKISVVFIVFFALVSASAGALFWHKQLEVLPGWQAWVFGTLFSMIVSGTLIACELYKRINNEVIRESIVSDHFTNEALLEDANEYAMNKLHDKYKVQIEEIGENTDTIKYAIEEHAISVYDNLLAGGKGLIPARIHREKVDKEVQIEMEHEETRRQLLLIKGGKNTDTEPDGKDTGPRVPPEVPKSTEERVRAAKLAHPNATQRELAEMLNLSVSTVHKYAVRRYEADGGNTLTQGSSDTMLYRCFTPRTQRTRTRTVSANSIANTASEREHEREHRE